MNDQLSTVTTDEQGKPTAAPQPKVVAGAVTGIVLTVVVGSLNAITPDLFAWAGAWGPVLFAGTVALGSALAAYVKRPSAAAS